LDYKTLSRQDVGRPVVCATKCNIITIEENG